MAAIHVVQVVAAWALMPRPVYLEIAEKTLYFNEILKFASFAASSSFH
jgi:hypothetical protein